MLFSFILQFHPLRHVTGFSRSHYICIAKMQSSFSHILHLFQQVLLVTDSKSEPYAETHVTFVNPKWWSQTCKRDFFLTPSLIGSINDRICHLPNQLVVLMRLTLEWDCQLSTTQSSTEFECILIMLILMFSTSSMLVDLQTLQ